VTALKTTFELEKLVFFDENDERKHEPKEGIKTNLIMSE
jgi:hypothetical protein